MAESSARSRRELMLAGGLIAVAILCRFIDSPPINPILSCIRTSAYMLLYFGWILSVRRRIVLRLTRNLLIAVGVCALVWIIIRTIKYSGLFDPAVNRLLWYLFYLPMNLMITICPLVGLTVGKSEKWRLPRWIWGYLAIPCLLAIAILFNDCHQLAFRFTTPEWSEDAYSYGPVYWVSAVWDITCGFMGLLILLWKCRIPRHRHFLFTPFIPALLAVIYCAGYCLRIPVILSLAGDMTAFLCLLFTATMECCIQCGLIRSSSNYDTLFRISNLHALITNRSYQIVLAAENSMIPTEQQMRKAGEHPVTIGEGIRLSGAEIRDGYVFWTEDVSELTEVLEELEAVGSYLMGERAVLEKETETNRAQQKMVEKNRLYNRIMTETNDQIELYSRLVEQLNETEDPQEMRDLVSRIAVVCAYIKRRDNLIFLDNSSAGYGGRELKFCLEETIDALRLRGVECACTVNIDCPLSIGSIARLFEGFYTVAMACLDSLTHLFAYVDEVQENPVLTLRLVCQCDLSALKLDNVETERDGNGWIVTIEAEKGGCAEC